MKAAIKKAEKLKKLLAKYEAEKVSLNKKIAKVRKLLKSN